MNKIHHSAIIKASQVVMQSAAAAIATSTACILGSKSDCRHNNNGCASDPDPEQLPCIGIGCKKYASRRYGK